jgi:thioesterase domain-containing protein/NAD(P)-dependent dehydrogenase (short-subunit alcohol dehydrogenase family)/acyl carrier protein
LWAAGVRLDVTRLFAGEARRRESLPTYPFERQRFWIDPDRHDTGREKAEAQRKRSDVGEWFSAPSWGRSTPPPRAANPLSTWLVFADASALSDAVVAACGRAGHRVITVVPANRFSVLGDLRYSLDPAVRSHFDLLVRDLREHNALPTGILHLWATAPRPRGGGLTRRAHWDPISTYEQSLGQYYFSLIFAAQAFATDADRLRIVCVSSHMQSVPGDGEVHPEKAVLLGPCKVIPREYPHVRCMSIDVNAAPGSEHQIAGRLLRELEGEAPDAEIALRGTDRWVRRFDPIRLAPADERPWLRDGGVYLLTGGLGGIALRIAEHLATHARVKLVLVGRTGLPDEGRHDDWLATHAPEDETSRRIRGVRAIRALGAEVMTVQADVADVSSMRALLSRVHERFGPVRGAFHAAGTLNDQIIALRSAAVESSVLDSKMKGALVLDSVLAAEPLDFFVMFSSVASILGLPGQAEYTAANAFLDTMAHARAGRGPGRTLTINWNAWQDVGMLAAHVRRLHDQQPHPATPASRPAGRPGTHPALEEVVVDDASSTLFRTSFRRDRSWLLAEHVVRGGDALISGTGMLEIARAALEYRREPRSVELRDVFFLEPFKVLPDAERTMHVRIERSGEGAFTVYGDAEKDAFVVGKARYVDVPRAPRVDLDAIRARCTAHGLVENGQLVQHFMDFGPRWGSAKQIDLGNGEALVSLELPAAFVTDLEQYPLHPAMLDLATGGAQAIVPGFDPYATFNVPFSYERVLIRRPMTQRVFSHVRLRDAGDKDSVVFDATLVDEQGEEIATIENFVMRKVAASFVHEGAHGAVRLERARPARRVETPSEVALREGMTPAEGVDALDRMLLLEFSPQVAACTLPLQPWIERLDEEARASLRTDVNEESGPVFTRPSVSATFAAPRDEVERELASQWKTLLGVADVGVNDDFFELGGQSLVAVRLFQRIGRKYGVELPLSALFQAPTIAECATLLRERLGLPHPDDAEPSVAPPSESIRTAAPAKPAFRALVAVQRGGDRLPFFCVHGAGGNVLNFRDLARAMHPEQPFYGLQAAGVDGVSPPRKTIEEMADAYVAEIREFQPQGPYLLGGYSGGGIVAFEIARRLTALGQEVGLLAFIDTFHPQMPARDITVFSRLERLSREGLSYLKKALETQRREAQAARDEREIEGHLMRGEPIPFNLRELYLWRVFERAQAMYQPQPWSGRAMLFRAETLDYFFQGGGPTYGWDRDVLGGVDVVTVPGDHSNLLLGPNAETVVRSLSEAIDRVTRSRSELAGAVRAVVR